MASKTNVTIDWRLFEKMYNNETYPYDVDKCYCQMLANKVSEDTGVAIRANGSTDYYIYSDTKKRISCREITSYEDLVNWVESQIGGAEGKDKSYLKNYFSYFFSNVYLKDKVGEMVDYGYSFPQSIFSVLIYATTGDVNSLKNLKEYDFMDKAQKISDEHRDDNVPTLFYPTSGLRYQRIYGEWIDLGFAVDKVFDGLKVKFFQNKKIQIKGLTNEEWENIKKIESYCRER